MALLGEVTALPAGAEYVPWDGPTVRIIEHRGHSVGHAALLIEERGVLVAGDMLSDILIPFLDGAADDPIGDYVEGLRRIEAAAGHAAVVVPGHGNVGDQDALQERLALDRAYLQALATGDELDDWRLAPDAYAGEWLPDVHAWQASQLANS